jgi:hypothetical protein
MKVLSCVYVFLIVLTASAALAEVPGLISYQGTLTDAYSVALDTTVAMTFSVYTDSVSGTQVWTETQPAVAVGSGIFSVLLGSVNAIEDTVFSEPDRWLGVQVGGDAELVPRQRMASVAYALRAGSGGSDTYWSASGSDIYYSGGDVGIGTSHPVQALDVYGDVQVGGDSSAYDLSAEAIIIRGRSGAWHVGVQNETTEEESDFYIGLASSEDGIFHIENGGNVGIGTSDPAARLDVRGTVSSDSAYQLDGQDVLRIQDYCNLFIGVGAGVNTVAYEGTYNTYVGYEAGYSNMSGPANVCVGAKAGYSGLNIGASDNVCIGYYAGYANMGKGNTFVGGSAGSSHAFGSWNTYIGNHSGMSGSGGNGNTFVGSFAGNEAAGDSNTFIGYLAGNDNLSGGGNLFLGYQAGYYETGSNKLYIANGKEESEVLIYGNFSSGRLGMGTLSPDSKLHITSAIGRVLNVQSGALLVSQVANIERTNTVESNNDVLQLKAADGSDDDCQFIECERGSDVEFKVNGDGNVYADGSLHAPADFSEMIAVSSGAGSVEPGDVMVIDPAHSRAAVKSSEPRSTLVAGIYSTRPGFVGSERDWDKPARSAGEEIGTYTMQEMAAQFGEVPLAVVGIAPCKVSAENGAIRPGDLLVTSGTPGHAMRDDRPSAGTILGKALEPMESGTGLIRVLVTLQ